MRFKLMGCVLAAGGVLVVGGAGPDDEAVSHVDWAEAEAPVLTYQARLTDPEMFIKAGEAYFSPDGHRVIFQAVEHPPEGEKPSPHYAMYVADLTFKPNGEVAGLRNITRVSAPGSANTCGWFNPKDPSLILFGSTMAPPKQEDAPGYQRGTSKYAWSFPRETEIVSTHLPEDLATETVPEPKPIFERDGYDAEGSWSPDGRWILYTHAEPPKDGAAPDGDIWVYDTLTHAQLKLVAKPGYDGGPFFSPDGKRIIYRSDRNEDSLLQLYEGVLTFDDAGAITGVEPEIKLTDDKNVNWAPFIHPYADLAVFATSRLGHANYEVYAIDTTPDAAKAPADRVSVRVTRAAGFDGLPVFSRDGMFMMWTSQRAPEGTDQEAYIPSSQVWIARFNVAALRAKMFEAAMQKAAESHGQGG
ncbi:MAG: hypothetical protein R3B57_04100 [Phycisphaerales bacterium]